MAQLAHTAVSDLRQAVRERRSAFVVGPACSGLTWLVNQSAALGLEPIVRFSVRGIRELDDMRDAVRRSFGLMYTPRRPSDLQLALLEFDSVLRPQLIIVNDCHRASSTCLTWLLAAALDPVAGMGRTAVPFIFEGAIDPDLCLASAFPDGYGSQPLIHYVEPSIPWRVLSEVENIMRGRWRQSFLPGLIPWIADVSGGDVGLVQELLERLPNEGEIHDETLAAAIRSIIAQGKRAREIRESVREVNDAALLQSIASGQGVPGVVPSALEACALKRAYFAGLVGFDGIANVYRVRGSIMAQIVAPAVGLDPSMALIEGRFILARLLTFFAHIASFEIDVKAALRDHKPQELAAQISTATGLGEYHKRVKETVVRTCSPGPEGLARLHEALKTVLPESLSLLDQLRARLGPDPTSDAVLNGITFAQMTQMLRSASLIGTADEKLLEEINGYRNAFAHFRAEPYGRCVRLLTAISLARRALAQVRR